VLETEINNLLMMLSRGVREKTQDYSAIFPPVTGREALAFV
jgi:hypothetical protein